MNRKTKAEAVQILTAYLEELKKTTAELQGVTDATVVQKLTLVLPTLAKGQVSSLEDKEEEALYQTLEAVRDWATNTLDLMADESWPGHTITSKDTSG